MGTTAVKAVLVDDLGDALAEAEVQQPVSVPRPGWAEQDPDLWWHSAQSAVSAVMAAARRLPHAVELRAVGLSGQMHSSVFLDGAGKVIRPALLWNDVRTTEQCAEITAAMGLPGLRRTVGNLALEGFTAPKVLWLRQNEPGAYARLSTLLLAKDYVRYRLSGELATDPSDAAGTILFDVRRRRWSDELLSAVDIPRGVLPAVVGSTEVSGVVSAAAGAALGLPPSTPVVGGGADNAAGAVGSGVVAPGRVQCSVGTSGTLLTPLEHPRVDRRMRLHTFCHCVPGPMVPDGHGALRGERPPLAQGHPHAGRRRGLLRPAHQGGCLGVARQRRPPLPALPHRGAHAPQRFQRQRESSSACTWVTLEPTWSAPSWRASPSPSETRWS